MGGYVLRETKKNDFTARCVEYGLVESQPGSPKHKATVLFWSTLHHKDKVPPEKPARSDLFHGRGVRKMNGKVLFVCCLDSPPTHRIVLTGLSSF